MTNEQINIAIAEACGWEDAFYDLLDIPNYCNDLNAMHEAEKVLGEVHSIKSCEYDDWLQSTTEHDQKWRATAAQRAEAFLKTIGKWEGAK
jgi:hypothetical protein